MLWHLAADLRKTRADQLLRTESQVVLQAVGGFHVQETIGPASEQRQQCTACHGEVTRFQKRILCKFVEPTWLQAEAILQPLLWDYCILLILCKYV